MRGRWDQGILFSILNYSQISSVGKGPALRGVHTFYSLSRSCVFPEVLSFRPPRG